AKTFPMGNETVRIGQVNVVDIEDILVRKKEILETMQQETKENDYDLYVLLVTDIIESNSVAIVDGPAYRQFEIAFENHLQLNKVDIQSVISRNKQVVPQLNNDFKYKNK